MGFVGQLADVTAEKRQNLAMHGGTYRYFMRGKSTAADASDFKVQVRRKPKLQPYDEHLRKFAHRRALDAALKVRGVGLLVSTPNRHGLS